MVKQTQQEVIEGFKKAHGDTYDYSKVEYTNSASKVIIICKTHGEFQQVVGGHMSGKGCRLCNGGSKLTTAEFVARAAEVHHGKYTYFQTMYRSMKDTVVVTCPLHGDFTILAEMHTAKARGCKKCSNRYRRSAEEFIEDATLIHKGLYTYANSKYIDGDTHLAITCKVHGDFMQTPYKHLTGQGCSACNHGGFASNKPGILYYLRIDNGRAYKIGITNRTVDMRFTPTELSSIEVVQTWNYENGEECHKKEQEIIKQYKEFKYTGPNLLESGNTELFSKDVLGLYKKELNNDPN